MTILPLYKSNSVSNTGKEAVSEVNNLQQQQIQNQTKSHTGIRGLNKWTNIKLEYPIPSFS